MCVPCESNPLCRFFWHLALPVVPQEHANTLINSSHPYTVHLWNNTPVLFFLHRWPPLLSRSLHRPLRCYEHNHSHLWHPGNGPTRLKREEDGSALLTRCHTREIEQGRGGGERSKRTRRWGGVYIPAVEWHGLRALLTGHRTLVVTIVRFCWACSLVGTCVSTSPSQAIGKELDVVVHLGPQIDILVNHPFGAVIWFSQILMYGVLIYNDLHRNTFITNVSTNNDVSSHYIQQKTMYDSVMWRTS